MSESLQELRVRVPAKINLYLQVLGRRADGYHEVRTVMQAVDLCDELEVGLRSDRRLELSCTDPDLPTDRRNLVMRAAHRLRERFGQEGGADVRLLKRIPVEGGLGGGSADGALALCALTELWGLDAGREDLEGLAAGLGSDVAFFLHGGTALCTGRGQRVRPLECPGVFHYVLIMPQTAVSTAEAYHAVGGGLTSRPDTSTKVVGAVKEAAPGRLGRALRNDLQGVVLELDEDLAGLSRRLDELREESGIERFLLSGSGACFFGLARGRRAAREAADTLEAALGVPCVAAQSVPAWEFDLGMLTLRRRHL
ncbi:MAG: 4-(cytidine 5'-diphospho)-2-C-methyl-D-erythritol kinase [Planctomycetota bacterium]